MGRSSQAYNTSRTRSTRCRQPGHGRSESLVERLRHQSTMRQHDDATSIIQALPCWMYNLVASEGSADGLVNMQKPQDLLEVDE